MHRVYRQSHAPSLKGSSPLFFEEEESFFNLRQPEDIRPEPFQYHLDMREIRESNKLQVSVFPVDALFAFNEDYEFPPWLFLFHLG